MCEKLQNVAYDNAHMEIHQYNEKWISGINMVRPVKIIVSLIQNFLFKIGCFKAFKLKYDCAKNSFL